MSDSKMNTLVEKKSVWWKEPMVWLIIGLPVSAVIGGAITVWFATDKPDPLVSDDYYKEGFAVHQATQREQLATSLGISARLRVANANELNLQLRGRFATMPTSLAVRLVHPSDSTQDIGVQLPAVGDGLYRAPLPPVPAGKRRLIIEPADHAWRLNSQWNAPFTGTLEVTAAGATNSSTPP